MNPPTLNNIGSWLAGIGRRSLPWIGLLPVLVGFSIWVIKPAGDLTLTFFAYALVGAGSFLWGLIRGFWLDVTLAVGYVVSSFIGILGTFVGTLRDNPGANSEAVFFVLLPAAWVVYSASTDLRLVHAIVNMMPLAATVLGVLGVIGVFYWLDATHRGSFPWALWLDLGQRIGTVGFGYELNFWPISSLVFLLPFLFMSLVVRGLIMWRLSRAATIPASVLTLILLFVSGRRVLFLTLAVGIVVGFALLYGDEILRRMRIRFLSFAVAACAIATVVAFASGFSIIGMLRSLQTEVGSSNDVRTRSDINLISSWSNSPWLGNGFGAVVDGAPRSVERPWAFELQYHLIVNAVGLIGFTVFVAITLMLGMRAFGLLARNVTRYQFLVPVIAGTSSALAANASNPYLHTPGQYWMFFLLILRVNAAARDASEQRGNGELAEKGYL